MAKLNNPALYAFLLLGQTVSAFSLFWMTFPVFSNLVAHLGQHQDFRILDHIEILAISVVLQFFYWMRLNRVAIAPPGHNIFVAHLFLFASRVSFFFGGALFSVVFFRHLPELDIFPPVGQAIVKVVYVSAILFSLFCYSLELDRLARAVEQRPLVRIKDL